MLITKAFHSFWSKPGQIRNQDNTILQDYELLTMMLSALKWREKNGPITMITDSVGADFFERNGLLPIWDGVETTLDQIPDQIDPFLFWAVGKLYALKGMKCPCAMVDTDLIVWRNIETYISEYQVVAAHDENLDINVYPCPQEFHLKEGYHIPNEWDFSIRPSNTSFLYIAQKEFCTYYVQSALDFVFGVENSTLNPITGMCFAEQRILPMCAAAKGLSHGYLTTLSTVHEQNFLTHLWGYKRVLSNCKQEREKFCRRCIRRLRMEFPQYDDILQKNPLFMPYLLEFTC
ncbi:MAG: DUF6734 family protein [Lachnospiraceae bacterium]